MRKSDEIGQDAPLVRDPRVARPGACEGKTKETTDGIRTSITEVVDAATQRFENATTDLRRTANDIRTELEQTRAELKKGVMDLPQETKESTTAMRKAVSDQINALKELSDIVAKSGRALDISSSRKAPAPAPAPISGVIASPASPFAPSRAKEADVAVAPAGDVETLPRAADPARAGTTGAASAQGGWVRDLLRGASREEGDTAAKAGPAANRSPLHVVESLNSLSVDIARAIDHEATAELWERYTRASATSSPAGSTR